MFARFHLLQVLLRIEIIYYSTVDPLLDGRAERGHFLFLIFQKAKTRTNDLAGVVVTPAHDA